MVGSCFYKLVLVNLFRWAKVVLSAIILTASKILTKWTEAVYSHDV